MKKLTLPAVTTAICLILILAACGHVAPPAQYEEPPTQIEAPFVVPLLSGHEPLVFNHFVSAGQMSFSPADWPIAFSHDLSDAQYAVVFSALGLNLNAQARYAEDGTLIDINAVNREDNRIHIHVAVHERSIGHTTSHLDENMEFLSRNLQTSQVHEAVVTARIIDEQFSFSRLSEGEFYFDAWFSLDGVDYHVCFNSTLEYGQILMTTIVNELILNGNEWIDLLREPIVPELHDNWLTLDEARLYPGFGAYLPTVPGNFVFERSRRFMNQDVNYLFAEWSVPHDYDYLYKLYTEWIGMLCPDADIWPFENVFWGNRVVNWYVTPWAVTDNRIPVLQAEEFSFDAVRNLKKISVWFPQIVYTDDSGDIFRFQYEIYRLNFAVRVSDEFTVTVHTSGVSAEDIWALFEGVA